jgi:hypothetical protein
LRVTGAALAGGALLALGETPAASAEFDLAHLMAMLGGVRTGAATFVERREVAMLDRTLESSGRLSFEAPDTFVRETLKPQRERLAISGNTVTMSRGSTSRSLQVDAAPEAAVVVEAIRGTLTGNREALERLFETRVSGSPERWWLDLVPRDARLRGQVASLRIGGEQAMVRSVAVQLADGDRSLMTIEPVHVMAEGPARVASHVGASTPAPRTP